MSGKIYLLTALALAAAPCFASTILVNNFSFETLPGGGLTFGACGAGCSYSESSGIPDWTVSPGAQIGQFRPGNPGNNNYFSALSDGNTSAYSNIDGSVISQTVGETVVVGEVYTLLIDIGWRFDVPFTGTADLLINGQTYSATGTTPTRGTFGVFTASYTGTSADVGRSITIELRSSGGQANFDNVRLDGTLADTGVPEPASLLLIAPALLALGFRVKRTARP